MDIAVQLYDEKGCLVSPAEGFANFQLTIFELPVRLGAFQSILHRSALKQPDQFSNHSYFTWKPGWRYQPGDTELHESDHPALEEFVGPVVTKAILRKRAPLVLAAGIKYARECYAPLLGYRKAAAEGLLDMARRYPRSFDAVATNPIVSTKARERFAIATLVTRWAIMKEFGQSMPNWPTRVEEYQRVIGRRFTTVTEMESAETRIKRWIKDTEEQGGLFL